MGQWRVQTKLPPSACLHECHRQVSIEEGDAKAREFNVNFIETSAKAGLNVKVRCARVRRLGWVVLDIGHSLQAQAMVVTAGMIQGRVTAHHVLAKLCVFDHTPPRGGTALLLRCAGAVPKDCGSPARDGVAGRCPQARGRRWSQGRSGYSHPIGKRESATASQLVCLLSQRVGDAAVLMKSGWGECGEQQLLLHSSLLVCCSQIHVTQQTQQQQCWWWWKQRL
jgi:hypothetical protein